MQMHVVTVTLRAKRALVPEIIQYVTLAKSAKDAVDKVTNWAPSLLFDRRFESIAACPVLAPCIRLGQHFD